MPPDYHALSRPSISVMSRFHASAESGEQGARRKSGTAEGGRGEGGREQGACPTKGMKVAASTSVLHRDRTRPNSCRPSAFYKCHIQMNVTPSFPRVSPMPHS